MEFAKNSCKRDNKPSLATLIYPIPLMHLSSASQRGGGGLMCGNMGTYGDFATNFCPCGGGNVGIFECPTLGENVGTYLLFN